MKDYIYKGKQFQFADKDVPEGAVPVDEVGAQKKEKKPENKAKGTKTK